MARSVYNSTNMLNNSKMVECGVVHNLKALSFFTAGASGVLILLTVALNFLILFAIWKHHKKSFKPVFFRAIFNIALADLFTGLVVDSFCLNYVIKEGLGLAFSDIEKKLSHLTFFVFSGVSVLTMGLLSIERLWALIRPFNHLKGMLMWKSVLILSCTWVTSILISLSYFKVGFIKCLVVFACTTVVLSLVLMILTLVIYQRRMSENQKKRGRYSIARSDSTLRQSKRLSMKGNFSQAGEKRVTKTFLLMLVVFLFSYLPTCTMIIYMNNCVHCDCNLIHAMRDLTYLFMVAGAALRPINFIARLRVLRRCIRKIVSRVCNRLQEETPQNTDVSLRLRNSTEKPTGDG